MNAAPPERVTFLLEIGTEEIPARMVEDALRDLGLGIHDALAAERLVAAGGFDRDRDLHLFGTPRRLACLAAGILARQPEARDVPVIGPLVRAAYDDAGQPTRAALGFARAQGVAVTDLRRLPTPKGESIGLLRTVPGRTAGEVLAGVIPPIVASMNFPKAMRWGSGEHRFVRPIHSVVALLDGEVVPLAIAGVRAGRATFGHRVAGRAQVRLGHASEYLEALRDNGVIADPAERRERIATRLRAAAGAAGGHIAPPPGSAPGSEGDADLLDEVTHLVEWPEVIEGTFDASFLDLPPEILVTAMRHHQKYFSILGQDGRLLNRFLAVINARGDRSGAIRRGNEWVLRARLADARFFWEEDRRAGLRSRSADLATVTFHDRLGSYAGKTGRMARLLEVLLAAFRASGRVADGAAAAEAVRLAKCDLVTHVVKEFPELQGIVGGLYARRDGLPEAVALALYGQYLPAAADDPVPPTVEGALLSLADRLDTQAGLFLLGTVPTGSRDPYGLRRSVLGTCRIVIENRVHLSLGHLLDCAIAGYEGLDIEGRLPADQARRGLLEFYAGRLQYLGEGAGLGHDVVRGVLAASCDDPYDAWLRMRALGEFRREADFDALVTIHKRIKNILAGAPAATPRAAALRHEAERALWEGLESARPAVASAAEARDYVAALRTIAGLRPALDRFFQEVMVMAEDRAVRENRMALLQGLAALFLRVADFSEVVAEREPTGRTAGRTTENGRK